MTARSTKLEPPVPSCVAFRGNPVFLTPLREQPSDEPRHNTGQPYATERAYFSIGCCDLLRSTKQAVAASVGN
jgi:hypothetical protein